MKRLVLALVILTMSLPLVARDQKKEINLRGRWKFQIGDDKSYANVGLDDTDWETLRVPRNWEDNGYPGYDGFAWYRTTFKLPASLEEKSLWLHLGYIDDVDEVYVNGHLVGSTGEFPPDYETAYDRNRVYALPHDVLKFGEENLIAVRVYDEWGEGGIVRGQVGIYSEFRIKLEPDLSGAWKFKQGDNLDWASEDLNDKDWETMMVPISWDQQGYEDYDGYGWYRKNVKISSDLKNEKIILALGKIDDIDEVYFNGVRIGRTGRFPGEKYITKDNSYFNRKRFYYIPSKLIKWDKKNVIAVRVYDVWQIGGIYEGPVGIITQETYLDYRDDRQSSFFEFMEDIFDGFN